MPNAESASRFMNELVATTGEQHAANEKEISEMVEAHPDAIRSVIEFRMTQHSVDQAFLTEAVPVLRELGRQDEFKYDAIFWLARVARRATEGGTIQDAETAMRGILRHKTTQNPQ